MIVLLVEVTGYTTHTVIGHLYTVDYGEYYKHVMGKILPVQNILLIYEGGSRILEAGAVINAYPDYKYGKFVSFEYQPDSLEKLKEILWDERYRRDHYKDGNIESFMTRLAFV